MGYFIEQNEYDFIQGPSYSHSRLINRTLTNSHTGDTSDSSLTPIISPIYTPPTSPYGKYLTVSSESCCCIVPVYLALLDQLPHRTLAGRVLKQGVKLRFDLFHLFNLLLPSPR